MAMLVEMIDTGRWSQRLLRSMDWKVFEGLCAEALLHAGYSVTRSPRKMLDGIDLVIRHSSAVSAGPEEASGIAVHCERSHLPISVRQVGEFYATATEAGFNQGVFVTTGTFHRRADQVFGSREAFQLITGRQFLESIEDLGEAVSRRLLAEVTRLRDYTVPTCPSCDLKMVDAAGSSLDLRWGKKSWVCRNRESLGCLRSMEGSAAKTATRIRSEGSRLVIGRSLPDASFPADLWRIVP